VGDTKGEEKEVGEGDGEFERDNGLGVLVKAREL
jgi:hypothetical protein